MIGDIAIGICIALAIIFALTGIGYLLARLVDWLGL